MFQLGEVHLLSPTKNNKMKVNRCIIQKEENRLIIKFGFNKYLKDEVKAMAGARWHGYDDPPRKVWSVEDSPRNQIRIRFLMGENIYERYDRPLIEFQSPRDCAYNHQNEISAHELTRMQSIVAGDMGVGKTLATIQAIERSGIPWEECFWVGPRSALDSVRVEFIKWKVMGFPRFMTYEEVRSVLERWISGTPAPRILICDECQKIKNPTSKRSQAIKYLADQMRTEYGDKCMIVLMSGTPAPKDPSDWYHLCEVASPGFLKEGNHTKFKHRLAKIETYDSITGGKFPKLVTWWDDENKCAKCGRPENDPDHDHVNMTEKWYHPFQKSINEVAKLYQRMSGLVIVKMKKDCLSLPEIQYQRIECKPTASTLRAASLISKTASSAIKGYTLLRELSDGFQYQETESGMETCPTCKGKQTIETKVFVDDGEVPNFGHVSYLQDNEGVMRPVENRIIKCTQCGGKGEVKHYERSSARVECPKDDAIINLLEKYEDEGRVVIWAGFTDSVERCVQTCLKAGWPVMRLDGRGWWSNFPTLQTGVDYLLAFANKDKYEKFAFVGQAGAGGMGINLTASSMEVFYSNTFRADDRDQAIARIHRPGADFNRGCIVYDLIHLPTDVRVLENLEQKRDLSLMTMGVFKSQVEASIPDRFD